MIEIRCSAQIYKKVATVRELITRETTADLGDLCAGHTHTFVRLEFYCGQARDIARRLVNRVFTEMSMGRVCCFAMRGTSQNQQSPLGRANLETRRFTDNSGINLVKLWFDCADTFTAAFFVRDKRKSDRSLKFSALDFAGCHDHRSDGALGIIRAEAD
jgi:hypothetical protein